MTSKRRQEVLGNFYETKDFSDLVFSCNGRSFDVHKSVVGTQSPVIYAAITRDFIEKSTGVIDMGAFTLNTVARFVKFLYTGTYAVSTANVAISDAETNGNGIDQALGIAQAPAARHHNPLLEQVEMAEIGDYYKVDDLIAFATDQIKELVENSQQHPARILAIPDAVEAAQHLNITGH